jgi:hypothetical protein
MLVRFFLWKSREAAADTKNAWSAGLSPLPHKLAGFTFAADALTCINEKSLTPGSGLIADPKDDAI